MAEPLKLFLIEDLEDVAFTMRKSLEKAGYQVQVCYSGKEGIEILKQSRFHMVVTGGVLADIDGLEVVDAVKRHCPGTPVIMVTFNSGLADKAHRAGVADFIVKDTGVRFLSELPNRVAAVLSRGGNRAAGA